MTDVKPFQYKPSPEADRLFRLIDELREEVRKAFMIPPQQEDDIMGHIPDPLPPGLKWVLTPRKEKT